MQKNRTKMIRQRRLLSNHRQKIIIRHRYWRLKKTTTKHSVYVLKNGDGNNRDIYGKTLVNKWITLSGLFVKKMMTKLCWSTKQIAPNLRTINWQLRRLRVDDIAFRVFTRLSRHHWISIMMITRISMTRKTRWIKCISVLKVCEYKINALNRDSVRLAILIVAHVEVHWIQVSDQWIRSYHKCIWKRANQVTVYRLLI